MTASPRSHAVDELIIVSHVPHHAWQGQIWAYGPYAREIDIWCDLFPRVTIAAPVRTDQPPDDAAVLGRTNVELAPQVAAGGDDWRAKLALVVRTPAMAVRLARTLCCAEAVHVRSPGNLGLMGVLLAPLFSRRLVAKYAGQWGGYPGEARSYRWQRRLLRSRWWRGPVTVYGTWPDQPPKVVPFFTSVLNADQVARARRAAARHEEPAPTPDGPLRLLFVGRLSKAKNVDAVIAAVRQLGDRDLAATATLIGEGPERERLATLATDAGVADRITFTGGLAFDDVLAAYERHDVLVLISQTEGWPKAIAEAMTFGLVAIGSNRGLVPRMLGDGRGLVVEPGDADGLTEALATLAADPARRRAMAKAAAAWGQRYSLDSLRDALGDLLAEHWHLPRDGFGDRQGTS